MTLQVRQVSKTYRGAGKCVQALLDVSLQVSPGELLAVHGASGSGKSTLLLCCGGLLMCDSGEIIVDGLCPYALGHRRRTAFRAEKVGFVFQQFHLIPYLNVLDNVLAASVKRNSPPSRERAMNLLEQFGMHDRLRHFPGELSVGERQRVALSRAMVNAPPLILADEPTGNLDPKNSRVVFQALRDYAESGKAVLVVTHEDVSLSLAHRTLMLDRGRLENQESRG
ncbi:MAG TPA: ABC transporter ATP-binding protein [Planctomycetes bacterium]|nr:ABC transporter ATP-binding protein [Planctomycetota bacterium]